MSTPTYTTTKLLTSAVKAAIAARTYRITKALVNATLKIAMTFISILSRAAIEAIAIVVPPPLFDFLRLFFELLEVEFGSIRRNQMHQNSKNPRRLEILQEFSMTTLQYLHVKVEMHLQSINWCCCTCGSKTKNYKIRLTCICFKCMKIVWLKYLLW
jgi:hypothetical protein